jgi:hypothetical protein
MYRLALAFAEESHYTQIKAKTLNGLAEIQRQQEAFKLALVDHSNEKVCALKQKTFFSFSF